MTYPEFKARYNIIAAQLVAKAKNDKAAANSLLEKIQLDKEKYRCGHTKVFFRAGILGFMEEVREDRIGSVLAWLQAGARGKSSRMAFKKLQDQKLALYCCQRAMRNRKIATTWRWMELWLVIYLISLYLDDLSFSLGNQAQLEMHSIFQIQSRI